MSNKKFIADLSSTEADIRVLKSKEIDAKKIKLQGKNILDYISESEFDSYDTRDPQLKNDELDVWNTAISLSDNSHIEVKPDEHTYEEMTDEQKELLLNNAAKVIDNEVLDTNDNHLMYWQTDGLTDGSMMFWGCENLTTFDSDFSSLTHGNAMFLNCFELTSFTSDLSSLTDGPSMFGWCANLASFSSNLSSLTYGSNMFENCRNLTSFSSNLSSLTNGEAMFMATNLTSFNGDLSSLTKGYWMFSNCKLDAPSVANIVHTLPQRDAKPTDELDDGNITIGIGCDDNEADQLLFAQECDCETWQELLDDFSAKNWTVTFSCNGRPTTTYNMRRGATLPIYAKLVEVIMPTDENERKPHYAYTSQDGSKFYNINYFHSTNGSTEGYDVFSSLEEAISTYNVTPKN